MSLPLSSLDMLLMGGNSIIQSLPENTLPSPRREAVEALGKELATFLGVMKDLMEARPPTPSPVFDHCLLQINDTILKINKELKFESPEMEGVDHLGFKAAGGTIFWSTVRNLGHFFDGTVSVCFHNGKECNYRVNEAVHKHATIMFITHLVNLAQLQTLVPSNQ